MEMEMEKEKVKWGEIYGGRSSEIEHFEKTVDLLKNYKKNVK